MALKKCKECGKEVSKSAKTCPNCGTKLKMGFFSKLFIFIFALTIAIVISNRDQKQKELSEIDWKNLPTLNESGIKKGNFEYTGNYYTTNFIKSTNPFLKSSSAPDGIIYLVVNINFKNISKKPIGAFQLPYLKLLDPNNTEYQNDSGLSSKLVKTNGKILSKLNPGISNTKTFVFELSKDLYINKAGWKFKIEENSKDYYFNAETSEKENS